MSSKVEALVSAAGCYSRIVGDVYTYDTVYRDDKPNGNRMRHDQNFSKTRPHKCQYSIFLVIRLNGRSMLPVKGS